MASLRRAAAVAVLAILASLLPVAAGAQEVPVASWGERSIPTARDLSVVYFATPSEGWVGADDGLVYRTTDGGRRWRAVPTGLLGRIRVMTFVDASTGWVATVDQGIARTTDGGRSWTVVEPGEVFGTFHDLHYVSTSDGYRVGQRAIFQGFAERTTDGGQSWELLPLAYQDQDNYFSRIRVSSDGETIWVLTWLFLERFGVSVSRDAGQTWEFVPIPARRLVDMEFASDTVGVAVGDLGEIWRTTDAGATWLPAVVPSRTRLNDIVFVDEQRGWAVGEAGMVLSTIDGGLTWLPEAAGTATTFTGVSVTAAGDGYAVGSGGEVRRRFASTDPERVISETIGPLPGEPHPPIVIAGDDDFDSPLSGVRSGTGTPDDPYVIEGWDLVPSGMDAVTLVGTTRHVVIRDNRIHDTVVEGAAVRLLDAANVTVEGNVIERTRAGILVSGGSGVTVGGNAITDTGGDAIEIATTTGAGIEGNRIRGAGANAIEIIATPGSRVVSNEVVGARLSGIRLGARAGQGTTDAYVAGNAVEDAREGLSGVSPHRARIEGNSFGLSTRHGVELLLCADTTLDGNRVFASGDADVLIGTGCARTGVVGNEITTGGRSGVLLQQDQTASVTGNLVRGRQGTGIRADTSSAPVIDGNEVTGPDQAIRVVGTPEAVIRDNVLASRFWGIDVRSSPDTVVENNEVGTDATVQGDTIHWGIEIKGGSHRSVVRGNVIPGTWTGVDVAGGSEGVLVEGNRIWATRIGDGVSLNQGSHDAVVRANVIEIAARHGVAVRTSDRALVEDNEILEAGEAGLTVLSSSDVIFRGNRVGPTPVGYLSRAGTSGDALRNLLEHNTFSSVGEAGVRVEVESARRTRDLTVRDNVFAGTTTAWKLDQTSGFTASGNNLDGFAVGLDATSSGAVDVVGNWWGAADGPSGAGPGSGAAIITDAATTVLYDPWLTEPKPDAGAV